MSDSVKTHQISGSWNLDPSSPASLARVMEDVEQQEAQGEVGLYGLRIVEKDGLNNCLLCTSLYVSIRSSRTI